MYLSKQGRCFVKLQAQLFGGVMLAHIIQASIAANHGAGLVLGLVHHLGVVGSIKFGHGHKRGPQRMRRVPTAKVLLRKSG